MSSASWKSLVSSCCLLFALCGSASAQVCGDADNDGQVSVTDGVQALRAAADLSSTCTNSTCDVDGDGNVSVTDGVNVLRKVAGLTVTGTCGGRDAQVERLIDSSLPIFGAFTKLGAGSASAAGSAEEPCENSDGSVFLDSETGIATFQNCQLEGFVYDGLLGISGDTIGFELEIFDLTTGEQQFLDGQVSGRFESNLFIANGFFAVSSSFFGDFNVEFRELASDAIGFVGGSLAFTVDDPSLPEVDFVVLTFQPSEIVFVDVVLVDGEAILFDYNLNTGDLVPVSN